MIILCAYTSSRIVHSESCWINNTLETKTLNCFSIACKEIALFVLSEVTSEKSHLVNQSSFNKIGTRVREKQRTFLWHTTALTVDVADDHPAMQCRWLHTWGKPTNHCVGLFSFRTTSSPLPDGSFYEQHRTLWT